MEQPEVAVSSHMSVDDLELDSTSVEELFQARHSR